MIKSMRFKHRTSINAGFTLIELMITVVIIAILAAIAIPSYQTFIRRAAASQAMQEIQKIAEQLERHKGRNFNYRGYEASYLYKNKDAVLNSNFTVATQALNLPLNGATVKYTLNIVDGASPYPLLTSSDSIGQTWAIIAKSKSDDNFSFLMTSDGLKCKNKASVNLSYASCGGGGKKW